MSETGWDEQFEEAFAQIVAGWSATEPEIELLKQFAVEFYGRFYAVLSHTLDEQIAKLVSVGLNGKPDLLAPANAAALATSLWLPPKMGTDLLGAYMQMAHETMWATDSEPSETATDGDQAEGARVEHREDHPSDS